MKLQSLKPRHKGFTLIELLVVIAIIAILAAILFPVFARARENARRSSCQSNLKQIALGVFQYTQDYDEKMPMAWYGVGDYYTNGWAGVIQPYVKSAQLFQCPSEPNAPNATTQFTDYGYNRSLGTAGGTTSIAALNFPSVTVLNYDYKTYSADASWFDNTTITDALPAYVRHLDGGNYSFADGHVKWYRPEKVKGAANGNYYDDAGKCAPTGASYAGLGEPTFCY